MVFIASAFEEVSVFEFPLAFPHGLRGRWVAESSGGGGHG